MGFFFKAKTHTSWIEVGPSLQAGPLGFNSDGTFEIGTLIFSADADIYNVSYEGILIDKVGGHGKAITVNTGYNIFEMVFLRGSWWKRKRKV